MRAVQGAVTIKSTPVRAQHFVLHNRAILHNCGVAILDGNSLDNLGAIGIVGDHGEASLDRVSVLRRHVVDVRSIRFLLCVVQNSAHKLELSAICHILFLVYA